MPLLGSKYKPVPGLKAKARRPKMSARGAALERIAKKVNRRRAKDTY